MSLSLKYNVFPPLFDCRLQCEGTPNPDGTLLFYSGPLKMDTGADLTAFPAKQLRITVDKTHFTEWIQRSGNLVFNTSDGKNGHLIAAALVGVDAAAAPIQFYALQVDDFRISSSNSDEAICLGSLPIFVTFDERFDKALLGRDIISLLNIEINNDQRCIRIEETNETRNYRDKYGQITPQYFIDKHLYSDDTMLLHLME